MWALASRVQSSLSSRNSEEGKTLLYSSKDSTVFKNIFYERPVNSSYAMCSIIFIGPNLFISTHSSFLFTPQSGFLRHPLLLRGVTCYCHPHVTPSPMYWRRTGGTRLRQIYHGLLPSVSVVVLSCDVHARDVWCYWRLLNFTCAKYLTPFFLVGLEFRRLVYLVMFKQET